MQGPLWNSLKFPNRETFPFLLKVLHPSLKYPWSHDATFHFRSIFFSYCPILTLYLHIASKLELRVLALAEHTLKLEYRAGTPKKGFLHLTKLLPSTFNEIPKSILFHLSCIFLSSKHCINNHILLHIHFIVNLLFFNVNSITCNYTHFMQDSIDVSKYATLFITDACY